MRIGLFTDTYYPQINGVATSVYLLKKYLELDGHEVFVCTTSDPLANEAEEKTTYRTKSLPFVSERRIGALFSSRVTSLVEAHQPEIIHTHTEFSLGIFGRRLAHKLNVPHVHTYHTIYEDYTHFIVKFGSLDTMAKAATRAMSRAFCNSANEVIVPTQKVKDLLLSYKVTRPIHILPTGIEIDRFNPSIYSDAKVAELRREEGIEPDDFVLQNIGRVSVEKNLVEVIDYSAPLLREHPHYKLLFVGNGPDLENYKQKAKDLGLSRQIIFAGAKPWDEIGLYYQLGDVFVSGSRSETQGLTYIEAMAAGLPVVARRDPCLDRVILEKVNGYMYETQEEFASYINRLAENEGLRRSLSREALKQAEQFSAQEFAARMIGIYRDAKAKFTHNVMEEEFNYKNWWES